MVMAEVCGLDDIVAFFSVITFGCVLPLAAAIVIITLLAKKRKKVERLE